MTDSATEAQPQVVDDPPQRVAFDGPRAVQNPPPPYGHHQRKPAGPQLWAVVLTLGGLYYVWTRVLGKSLPGFARGAGGNRVGVAAKGRGGGDRQAEIRAARERQQQKLEMMQKASKGNGTVRERNVVSSGNNNNCKQSIQEQQRLLKERQAERQKEMEMEAKKKKQRQLYLKQKALKEKEEEKRKKDEELGPGWEYRQDPNAANAVNSMDPQAGSGGGYKPAKACTRRGG